MRIPVQKNEFAEKILERFIRPEAEKQINIEAKYLKDVLKKWDSGDRETLFDIAMSEVWKLMKLDSYKRFSGSVFFNMMLQGNKLKEEHVPDDIYLKFMEMCTGRDQKWELLKSKSGIELYEREESGGQLLKTVFTVKGNSKSVGKFILDINTRKEWEKDCLFCKVVQEFSDHLRVIHVGYKGTKKVDFSLVQIDKVFTDGTVCIIMRSVDEQHEGVAEEKGFLRLEMDTGGFMLEVIEGRIATKVTYISQMSYSQDKQGKKIQKDVTKHTFNRMSTLRSWVDSRFQLDRRMSIGNEEL